MRFFTEPGNLIRTVIVLGGVFRFFVRQQTPDDDLLRLRRSLREQHYVFQESDRTTAIPAKKQPIVLVDEF